MDLSAGGLSVDSRLQLNKRWCAVCMGFSGHLQCGEGSLFILCRYERKLPWFVRNWVISLELQISVKVNNHHQAAHKLVDVFLLIKNTC